MNQKDLFQILNNFNREIIKDKAIQATWEENKKGKIEILMPDATIKKGNSELDLKKVKDGHIVFFKGLGYSRFNKDEKIKFWFGHD
jgi:hypothetical protein